MSLSLIKFFNKAFESWNTNIFICWKLWWSKQKSLIFCDSDITDQLSTQIPATEE